MRCPEIQVQNCMEVMFLHEVLSSHPIPDDGGRDSSRNVDFFRLLDTADGPRGFYYVQSP
jgi:hypothetical protein